MAFPPKPPHDRGRRLSELLEEQQEPFLLDVYLLEKGCSERLFASQPRNMCWPVNACRRLQRIPSHDGFTRRCWLLKCMLTKFLNGRVIRKALNWDKKLLHFPYTGSKKNDDAVDVQLQWKCIEEEENSKQLSPVSVLEMHSCEASPVHITNEEEDESALAPNSPRKDLDIFRELVELAYTSALNQFAKSKKQLDEEIAQSKVTHEESTSWHREKDDLSCITQLTFSDISNSKREWHEFQPQVREIVTRIEKAIFEDIIREDVILELQGLYCTLE
ncbi:hypothetical protein Cni_G07185 [Canna indica]|uniref:DUF4378 domain-containing protein n=1 Tax=Canna indica TaxID=4628 RepID=A0AAQ3JZW8_9LILI|nr:hypothetical protein Cni_G07185 [Canna indica]